MPSFFDQEFKEQAEKIIGGDLALLQMFIGVRNPIGLLQYYASFIIAKINIMNARLYGEYKLQERCLTHYRDNMTKEDAKSAVASTTAALCVVDKRSDFYTRLVLDCSENIKEGLLVNLLLPMSDAKDKKYDSVCNVDYLYSSNIDSALINYVRNTEIGNLCTINVRQIIYIYATFTEKSKNFVRDVLKKYPDGSTDQRKEINLELSVLKKKISEQEREIAKYKDSFMKIKDRSFLDEWYNKLVSKVTEEAQEKNNHIFYSCFPNDEKKIEMFIEKLNNQFISEVILRFLKEIISSQSNKGQCINLQDIMLCFNEIMMDQLVDTSRLNYKIFSEKVKQVLKEKINECDASSGEILNLVINMIKPDKIMKAEQSVLDDMLFEAVRQGKQDSALLLICNGADIDLERDEIKVREELGKDILEKSGFLIIRELYSSMPAIKACMRLNLDVQVFDEFVVEGVSRSINEHFGEFSIEDILTLAEMRDILPNGTALKRAADFLVERERDNLDLTDSVSNKEKIFQKSQKSFDVKKAEYKQWKWIIAIPVLALPFYSLPLACGYVAVSLAYAGVDVGKPWNTRYNARNELEVAQDDLDKAVRMFKALLEYLQCSVVAGSNVFKEKCKEIEGEINNIMKSKDNWVNLSSVRLAFKSAGKVGCFNTEAIQFQKLATNIINNRRRYMSELSQKRDQAEQSTGQTVVCQDNREIDKVINSVEGVQRGEVPLSELRSVDMSKFRAYTSRQKCVEVLDSELRLVDTPEFRACTSRQKRGEVLDSELRLVSIPEFRACTSRQKRVEVPDSELLSLNIRLINLVEGVQRGEVPLSELLSLNISQFKESTSKQQ